MSGGRLFDGSAPLAGSVLQAVGAADRDPSPGTPVSLEQIYAEHFAFVWRTLRALGLPPASLDDAAQDVFVVVHDRLHSFVDGGSVRAWLFGIARNVARRHRERGTRNSPLQLVHSPAPLEERVQWRERADVVAHFLASLDEGHREVFVAAQLDGMTAPEIAEALGIKLNTVYSRLRTARVRFEQTLAREEARTRRQRDG